jgi:cytosine permease
LTVIVIPILLVLLVATLIRAYQGVSLAEVFAKTPAQTMPLGILVSIVAGGYAVGAVIQPDITRYAKGYGHASWAMVFGMFVGFPLVLVMAAFLGGASGEPQFATVMLKYNIGIWRIFAIVVIVFATWTTNDNNLYSAALSFNAIFPKLKKWQLTVIGGALGTILALAGILGQMVNWILILGVTVPPIGAVMAVDFLLFRSDVYSFDKLDSLPAFRVLAYVSWAAGTLVGFLTYFKVFTFTTAPALDSIVVALVVHFVLMLIAGNRISVPKRAAA